MAWSDAARAAAKEARKRRGATQTQGAMIRKHNSKIRASRSKLTKDSITQKW